MSSVDGETTTKKSSNDAETTTKKRKLPPGALPPPPHYESQEYWDERYRKQQLKQVGAGGLLSNKSSISGCTNGERPSEAARAAGDADGNSKNSAGVDENDETSSSPHEWYFTYAELRPIVLPLILGGRSEAWNIIAKENENDDSSDDNHGDDVSSSAQQEEDEAVAEADAAVPAAADSKSKQDGLTNGGDHPTANAGDGIGGEEGNNDDDDDDNDFVEVHDGDSEEEDEEEEAERDGLAKHGPVSVLEVGCGDVPLGAGLAVELAELQRETEGTPTPRCIVREILCTDYSEVVVDKMRRQYKTSSPSCFSNNSSDDGGTAGVTTTALTTEESNGSAANDDKTLVRIDVGDVPLKFATADARDLPYDDERFQLILEKGTLDAMLSDKQDGCANCIRIVSECARVLSVGGYILIVSHLNAHSPKGISWLEEIVFAGLSNHTATADNNSKENGGSEESAAAAATFSWEIEVHGSDQVVEEEGEGSDDDDDDDEEEGQDSGRGPVGSVGPAVYVIHKREKKEEDRASDGTSAENDNGAGDDDDGKPATIPVKFFSY